MTGSPGAMGLPPLVTVGRMDRVLSGASILLLAAFVFFPYWSFVHLGMDIQPNALLLSLLVWLATLHVRMPPAMLLLALPAAFAPLLLLTAPVSFSAFRSAGNYIALWFIAFATFITLRSRDWLSPAVLKLVVGIWFAVGLAQVLFDPYFLVAIVNPGARAGVAGRGVVSLSTEPAHYGEHCAILFLLIQHRATRGWLSRSDAKLLQVMLAVQVIFFARSALAVLLLAAVVAAGIVMRHRAAPLRLLVVLSGMVGATVAAVAFATTTLGIELGRLWDVALALGSDPLVFFRLDGSANDRLLSVVGPFWAAMRSGFVPYGFYAWDGFVAQVVGPSSDFFWVLDGGRIMSGYGAAVFELGFMGLVIPVAITLAVRRSTASWSEAFILAAPLHLVILLTGPLAKPTTGLMVGYFAAIGRWKRDVSRPEFTGDSLAPEARDQGIQL